MYIAVGVGSLDLGTKYHPIMSTNWLSNRPGIHIGHSAHAPRADCLLPEQSCQDEQHAFRPCLAQRRANIGQ